jgi:hypothetical protein
MPAHWARSASRCRFPRGYASAVCPRFGARRGRGPLPRHPPHRHGSQPNPRRPAGPSASGPPAAAAGLSGRLTEPHSCEDASTLGGVEPDKGPGRAARPPNRDGVPQPGRPVVEHGVPTGDGDPVASSGVVTALSCCQLPSIQRMRAKVRRMKASSGAGATRKLDCRGSPVMGDSRSPRTRRESQAEDPQVGGGSTPPWEEEATRRRRRR